MRTEEPEDIWAKKSLKDFGYDEQQAEDILTAQSRNWYTADLFLVPPRDNEGSYFEKTTNLGREDAVKAFQAYEKGDKTKLAGIIAQGLNKAAKDLILEQKNDFSEQTKGIMASTSLLMDIMKKDPDLETLAKQQGLSDDNLQAAKGMAELHKIQKDREEAEYKMAKAIQEGKELTAEEKTNLLKPIIKGRLTQEQMAADNAKNCAEAMNKSMEIGENMVMTDRNTQDKWKADPQSRPDPGYKRIHMDTYNKVDKGIQKLLSPVSDTMKNLGTKHGPKHLDAITDEIIKQDGLAEKPTKDLRLSWKDRGLREVPSARLFCRRISFWPYSFLVDKRPVHKPSFVNVGYDTIFLRSAQGGCKHFSQHKTNVAADRAHALLRQLFLALPRRVENREDGVRPAR